MASNGPRPKLDHEPRPKRHKALEVANEPRWPKAHWDHVLEEMIWLSKALEVANEPRRPKAHWDHV